MADKGTPDAPLRISEIDFDSRLDTYPALVLTGDARTRGRTYGRKFAEKIMINVARHMSHEDLPPLDTCWDLIQTVYIPALKRHWPRGWKELQGMADGCDMELKYLVMLNVRDDLFAARHLQSPTMAESTSAFVSHRATAGHVPILGHSWNASKLLHDEDLLVCLEIHYPRAEEVLTSIFMVTEAGMISGCGMNSNGLAVAGNRLMSRQDAAPNRLSPEFPVTLLERIALEQVSLDGAREDCEALVRHASKHLLMAMRTGYSISLELSPPDLAFVHNGALGSNTKLHTNRFQSFESFMCRRNLATDGYRGKSSAARYNRLRRLILENGDEPLSRQQIQGMFSDHGGNGEGRICYHGENDQDDDEGSMTVAFVMFDMNRTVISICKGPPCKGDMLHFTFGEDKSVHASIGVNVNLEDIEMVETDTASGDTEMSMSSDTDSLWLRATGGRPPAMNDLPAPRNTFTGIAATCPSPTHSPARDAVQAVRENATADHVTTTSSAARSRSPVSILPRPPVDDRALAMRDLARETLKVLEEMHSSSEVKDLSASPAWAESPARDPALDPAFYEAAEDIERKLAGGEKRPFYDPVRDTYLEENRVSKRMRK